MTLSAAVTAELDASQASASSGDRGQCVSGAGGRPDHRLEWGTSALTTHSLVLLRIWIPSLYFGEPFRSEIWRRSVSKRWGPFLGLGPASPSPTHISYFTAAHLLFSFVWGVLMYLSSSGGNLSSYVAFKNINYASSCHGFLLAPGCGARGGPCARSYFS